MSCRIIAILNQKGGVGKTTTAINLGAALAEAGFNVLLIDLDPQANLTRGLGFGPGDVEESVYDVLVDTNAGLAPVLRETKWEGLFLAPSHLDLSGAEIEMVPMYGRETRLAKSMADLVDKFDFIFIDCLPSLSLLTVNAMTAATEVFVPMQAHPFALEGLTKLFEVFDLIKAQMNPDIELTGVLLTMFDTRTNVSKKVKQGLVDNPRTGPVLFDTIVRQNIKIAESQGAGVPVIHFDPQCHGAQAYRELAREFIARTGVEIPPMPPPDGDDAGGGKDEEEAATDPFESAESSPSELAEDEQTDAEVMIKHISRWWEESSGSHEAGDAAGQAGA